MYIYPTNTLCSSFIIQEKKNLVSRLYKDCKITLDELLLLLDRDSTPCYQLPLCPPPYNPYPSWTTGNHHNVVSMGAGNVETTSTSLALQRG